MMPLVHPVHKKFMPIVGVSDRVQLGRTVRVSHRLFMLILLLLFHARPFAANDQDDEVTIDMAMARELHSRGMIYPLGYFMDTARKIHPGQPVEAYLYYEPKHGCYEYEVYMLDLNGVVWEVVFNANTGKLIEFLPE
jgi:uncharacterized membrane protein YkoI